MPAPLKVTTPNDTDVVVTRSFDAPRDLVWRAHTEPKLVSFLQLGKSRAGHEIFIYRPERPAAFDPDVGRTKPLAQRCQYCNLIETAIGLLLPED